MDVASISNGMAQTATAMKSQAVAGDISAAVIQQILSSQAVMSDALIQMIQQTSQMASLDPAIGSILDVSV